MSITASDFLQRCPRATWVHLIGPLQHSCPQWLDASTIFVDGGAQWRSQLPEDFPAPTFSLGDGDSFGSHELDKLFDTEKDTSDLACALQLIESLDVTGLKLSGFLGGRRDHEWINFGEVARFLTARKNIAAHFENAVTLLSPGRHALIHHGLFSLAFLTPARASISGAVKYPLEQITEIAAHSSHGLSNVAAGAFNVFCDRVALCFFESE